MAARRRGLARWLWLLPLVAAVAFLRPASAAGLFFPDVDQLLLPVLGHRSVVTHSVLLPVLALALAPAVLARLPGRRSRFGPEARAAVERSAAWLVAWFLLGLAIHLMADLAPLGCRGYALAKLPGVPLLSRPSSLPCAASLLWFAANAVAALVLCEWLLRREGEAVTAARYLACAGARAAAGAAARAGAGLGGGGAVRALRGAGAGAAGRRSRAAARMKAETRGQDVLSDAVPSGGGASGS